MRMWLRVLLCGLLILPALGGNRMLQMRDRWAISSYEQTAIQRSGYDYAPTVIQENGAFRMWWCGSAPTGNPYVDHIWAAESPDGVRWTNQRVAVRPAPLGLICDPSVVRVGNTYLMYFTGTRDAVNGTNGEIYLATSTDGQLWTKYPSDLDPRPVLALPAPTTGYGIGQPSVIYLNSRYWMYYTDTTREGGGTFLASSADGRVFQLENGGHRLLATNSVDVKYSVSLSTFIMVHGSSHDKLYFSSSVDGIQWETPSPDRYLAQSPAKNKAFEGGLAGSSTGTMGTWTYFYYASQQGTPGVVQDPLSWDIDMGRLSFSALPASGTVFQSISPSLPSQDHLYDTRVFTPQRYDYESRAFAVEVTLRAGLTTFFRMYHPILQDHFYTTNVDEKNVSRVLGYQDEGTLGYIAPVAQSGTVPLFRLYHPRGDHFYTVDVAERDRQLGAGFRDEGVAGNVWPADRSGQPPAPKITAPALFSDPRAVTVDYDTTAVAGAFDTRLEVSAADEGFRFSNPGVADPMARISQRITGNSGTLRLSTEGFPNGRYQIRIAALDEAGSGLGHYSDSRSFVIGPPPAPDSPPFGYLDLPADSVFTNSTVAADGWALDDQGVARVEVFIDGNSVGLAARGRSRPDVRQVFPAYPNAETSGFRLETNVSQLATGTHLMLVELTDTIGQKVLLGPRFISVFDGGNTAPFGVLDLPREGATADAVLEIGGWALDDRGVSRVELLVDGVTLGDLGYGAGRPDVAVVFPGFPNNPQAGFSALLNTAALSRGTHTLTIRLTDGQGLSTVLPPRNILKP